MRNHLITAALCAALALSTQAHGATVHCVSGEQERVISVAYETQGQPVPCEVHYDSSDEGTEVLWSAQNEEGFCEARAEEFVEQHQEWGWRCDTADGSEELESMSNGAEPATQTDDY